MNVTIEKIILAYIYNKKEYASLVKPSFFKNSEVRMCYKALHEYYKDLNTEKPSFKQWYEMIKLIDSDGIITPDIFKAVVKVNLNQYSEEKFIKVQLKTFLLSNNIDETTSNIIEESRKAINETDLIKLEQVADNLLEQVKNLKLSNLDADDDLGSDFDDPDSHSQDHSLTKVKTGWNSLDKMTSGGWDVATLNVLMAMTNGGKSLLMQNIAVNAVNLGYNVVYFTFEMSQRKVMKRLGSMRLKIPIYEYDELSVNRDYMKQKIEQAKKANSSGLNGVFENNVGKMFVKFFPAGQANIELLNSYLTKLNSVKGIVPDLIIIDYITLMSSKKESLYEKGKELAEGLRAIGSKYNCPVVTATQISKDSWNTANIELDAVPESKAIVETADTVFGVIRTPEMKQRNEFMLKLLKQRDGDFSVTLANYKLNTDYLTLENDVIIS